MQIYRIRTRGLLKTCRRHVLTRGGLRRSAGRIPHSPPKQEAPTGSLLLCIAGFEPEFEEKAGVPDSCFFQYLCGESVLSGGVLNSCRRLAFAARCLVSQMTLRTVCVSPPSHQFRNCLCQTLRAASCGREADTPVWAPLYHGLGKTAEIRMALSQ